MAAARVCVVLVFICCCVRAALVSKGMFCIDPDTGKLHVVNSTWPSTTFCGNYTCRIREKNTTEMEFSPSIPVVNITKFPDHELRFKQNKTNLNVLVTTKSENYIKPILHKNNNNNKDDDRYLTESEIRTISEILHTVKKSDLDAIVEIYNLAQELYKEMDKSTPKSIIKDTLSDEDNENISDLKTAHNNRIKYWYEPINSDFPNKNQIDALKESTTVHTTTQKTNPEKLSYFKGTVSEHDFAKIPFHTHPNFHRPSNLNPSNTYGTAKPCQHQQYSEMNKNLMPLQLLNNVFKPSRIETPKKIPSPLFLPFPLSYMQQYGYRYPLGLYYNGIPFANYDYQRRTYPQTYLAKSFTSQAGQDPKTEMKTPEQPKINNNKANLIQAIVKATKKSQEKKAENQPSWQTKPLSDDILDEVRAHFDEKEKWLNGFPVAKGLLKRVGKVIKIDALKRPKRDIENDMTTNFGYYETYLVSTKCPFETEPGFFKNGDLSRPYPGCCPQRIDETETYW